MSLLPFFASPPQKPVFILFHWFDYNKRNYLPFLLLMIILPATSPTLNRGNQGLSENGERGISLEFCLFVLCVAVS